MKTGDIRLARNKRPGRIKKARVRAFKKEKEKAVHIRSLEGQYTDSVKKRIANGTAGRPYTSMQRSKEF